MSAGVAAAAGGRGRIRGAFRRRRRGAAERQARRAQPGPGRGCRSPAPHPGRTSLRARRRRGASGLMLDRDGPDPFLDTFTHLVAARAVTTAVMLGVFEALHDEPASADGPGRTPGARPAGRGDAGHRPAHARLHRAGRRRADAQQRPVTERLLVASSPESIATFAGDQADLHWEILGLLPEAVRSGRRYAMHEERRDERERWEAYIRGLFEISRPEQDANAALVGVEDPRLLVDVAGGHGGFAMAMCRRHPGLHATVIDLPPSAAVGRPDRRAGGLRRPGLLPRGRRLRAGPGRGSRRGVGLQPGPPPARGARPRAVPAGAGGAATRRGARDRRLGPARARGARVRARGHLEPAVLRLEPQPQLQPVRDRRLDGGGGLPRTSKCTRTSARPGGWWSSGDDPAHRGHGHRRLGASGPPDRGRRAGALPGARAAPAGRPARAGADRARRPRRPAVVSPRAAGRATRWCTWRPRSATSRAPRSRS